MVMRDKKVSPRIAERAIVAATLALTVVLHFFISQKLALLNLYFLPVVFAGYFLGKRMALLTGIFSVSAVALLAIVDSKSFAVEAHTLSLMTHLLGWGGFLILCAVVIGALYDQKERHLEELRAAYVGILEILAKYLEAADPYTQGHSVRVSHLSVNTAKEMGLSAEECENIRAAALLHDIGKAEISTELLQKASDLTDKEKEIVSSHPEVGTKILASVGSVLKAAIPLVAAHHQWVAGAKCGPSAEEQVPLGARIIAVADAFDAMTSDRPYRKGMPPWRALEELDLGKGKQFDAKVVSAFKHVVALEMETV